MLTFFGICLLAGCSYLVIFTKRKVFLRLGKKATFTEKLGVFSTAKGTKALGFTHRDPLGVPIDSWEVKSHHADVEEQDAGEAEH